MSKNKNTYLAKQIVAWYQINGRKDLPWRKNISVYKIWISEIMLQQTQVATVIPYFKRFIKEYPSLRSLIKASEDDILALWSGLGFYRRAKNIFLAKEKINQDFKGRFPKNFDDILSLPGIGQSTAGAISSIALNNPHPILDANVKRVLKRFYGKDFNEKELWDLSKMATPQKNVFEYTQGIMDIGAIICTSKKKDCDLCPLKSNCSSKNIPLAKKIAFKKINPTHNLTYKLLVYKKKYLLFKKTDKTFWDGLWVPAEDQVKNYKKNIKTQRSTKIIHKLSHLNLKINIDIIHVNKLESIRTNSEHKWVAFNEIEKIAIPAPIKKVINNEQNYSV